MYQGTDHLIGSELSFFTRKLEAQLCFQHIPWRYRFKTREPSADLEAHAGTHLIPHLQTLGHWVLHDAIAISPLLNDRVSRRAVSPELPAQRASCFILEDAFTIHWLSKSCVHSRWCYPDNVDWVGVRFGVSLMLDKRIDTTLSEQESQAKSSSRAHSRRVDAPRCKSRYGVPRPVRQHHHTRLLFSLIKPPTKPATTEETSF